MQHFVRLCRCLSLLSHVHQAFGTHERKLVGQQSPHDVLAHGSEDEFIVVPHRVRSERESSTEEGPLGETSIA